MHLGCRWWNRLLYLAWLLAPLGQKGGEGAKGKGVREQLTQQLSTRSNGLAQAVCPIEMPPLTSNAQCAHASGFCWERLQVEKKKAELARSSEASRTEQRGRDTALRRLNRAQMEGEQLQEQLTPLENASQNMRSQLGALQKQGAREAAASGRLQEEVLGMVEQVAAEKKLVGAGQSERCGTCRSCWGAPQGSLPGWVQGRG